MNMVGALVLLPALAHFLLGHAQRVHVRADVEAEAEPGQRRLGQLARRRDGRGAREDRQRAPRIDHEAANRLLACDRRDRRWSGRCLGERVDGNGERKAEQQDAGDAACGRNHRSS
jgi:hypothetical protein